MALATGSRAGDVTAWHELDLVDSTNDHARRLIRSGIEPATFCVLAREQTAGRGSRGRRWCSPRDAGLYFTLAQPAANSLGPMLAEWTAAAGAGCVDALRGLSGLPVVLRAVNDLFLFGGKLGGILTEAVIDGPRLAWLITGIGVNLRPARRVLEPGSAMAVSLGQFHHRHRLAAMNERFLAGQLAAAVLRWHRRVAAGQLAAVKSGAARRRRPVVDQGFLVDGVAQGRETVVPGQPRNHSVAGPAAAGCIEDRS